MTVTNIVPIDNDVYWFVDLGATVISGVTVPGLVTTTKFDIEQDEDEKILINKLKGKQHKLKEGGHGFCLRDGSVIFLRHPVDTSPLNPNLGKMSKA